MMIEIHGCSTRNKGAELMLLAIQQHYAACGRQISFAVERGFGSYEERARYGLHHKLSATRFGRSSVAIRLMPASFRRAYGLANESDVGAVLDASGFAFGDQHGPNPCEAMARKTQRWKHQGKVVILLPQAFGPFSSPRIRRAMRTVAGCADVLFARDEDSYRHVCEVASNLARIHRAPDFTCLVDGQTPRHTSFAGRACLVPNCRILEKCDEPTRSHYVPFLALCVCILRNLDLEPFLLVHDVGHDAHLAEQVRIACGHSLEIVRELDPLVLKGILGHARLVVASRYHALASALSQGVPCLATGWSHKYKALLEDYDWSEYLVSVNTAPDTLRTLLAGLSTPAEDALRALKNAVIHQREQTQRMWMLVDDAIGL